MARNAGDGSAQVELDYVPKYQGFTLGEFVYNPNGPLAARGYRLLIAPPRMQNAGDYLTDVGSGVKATPWFATSLEPQDTASAACSRADIPLYRLCRSPTPGFVR